jgi:PAS domain S-box-containing protein
MRIAAYALLLSIGYYLGATLGFALTFQPHPVSTLWPPNAILLAALLLTPSRWWWVLLLAAFPAHVAAELGSGVPTAMIFCWFISNCCEALIGAICIRRFSDGGLRFDALQRVGFFILFGVVLAPVASSFIDAGFVKLVGWGTDGYWQVWMMRTFSNVLASITIVPVILLAANTDWGFLRRVSARRLGEAVLLAIAIVAIGFIAFDERGTRLGNAPTLVYAPLPFLLWSALRFGPGGLSLSLLATDLLAIWGTIHEHGPFTSHSAVETVFSLQAFLILMAVPLMFLSAVISERHKTGEALRKSEARYRSVVETQTELICRYKPDTTLTFVNEAYCRFFDKTREELIGSKFINLIPPGARDEAISHIKSLLENPRQTIHEHKVLVPGDGIGWHQWVNPAILDVDGNIIEFQGVGRDVTEMRRAEEELRQSEERWRLVFDNSAVGILVTNPQCQFFATNAVYEQLLGYTKEELIGLTLFEVIEEGYKQPFRAVIDELLTGKRSQGQIEMQCRRKDEQAIWVSSSISAIHDGQGRPLYLIAVIEDITERRRTREALNELNAALEQRVAERTAALDAKSRELEAFAYSVAHDLKAPLRGIDGYSRLLMEDYSDKLGKEGTRLLSLVRASTDQMSRLIDDLLAYSRIEYEISNSRNLEVQSFIENLVEKRKKELHNDHIEFVTTIDRGVADLDAGAFEQALRNYLDNAVKFTRTVTAPRIEVGARQHDAAWCVWVRDNGVGFDMKHSKDVFEVFRRLHHDEEYEGTGLGLAIARKVIERMGGRVWVESAPGRGSTFFMEIPARPVRMKVEVPHGQ